MLERQGKPWIAVPPDLCRQCKYSLEADAGKLARVALCSRRRESWEIPIVNDERCERCTWCTATDNYREGEEDELGEYEAGSLREECERLI